MPRPGHAPPDQNVPCQQDVSGGSPVLLQGTSLPLWALEIDPEREKDEFVRYTTAGELGVWRGRVGAACTMERKLLEPVARPGGVGHG